MLLAIASLAGAADQTWTWSGGWDRIELHSGITISGRVLEDLGRSLRIDVGWAVVEIDKDRLVAFRQGVGAPDRAPTPLKATTGRRQLWTAEACLMYGLHGGELASRGTVIDHGAGTQQDVTITQDLGPADPGPGACLRLGRGFADIPDLSAGFQVVAASAAGSETTLRTWSLEAVASWEMHPARGPAWNVRLASGWQWARGKRDLDFTSAAGVVLDTASIADRLQGLTIRAEAGPAWTIQAWRLGGIVGASWSTLSGSSDWISEGGGYSGSFAESASISALYLGLVASRSW